MDPRQTVQSQTEVLRRTSSGRMSFVIIFHCGLFRPRRFTQPIIWTSEAFAPNSDSPDPQNAPDAGFCDVKISDKTKLRRLLEVEKVLLRFAGSPQKTCSAQKISKLWCHSNTRNTLVSWFRICIKKLLVREAPVSSWQLPIKGSGTAVSWQISWSGNRVNSGSWRKISYGTHLYPI